MSARDAIMSNIRRSLEARGSDAGRRAIVIARLDHPPRGVIPERGQLPPDERLALFCQIAEEASASIARVPSNDGIPEAVAVYLRDHNLPTEIRMGEDSLLAGLPWASKTQITIAHGPSDGSDAVSVSHAFAGVAETGTVVLISGSDNPTTLNFLPETHIVMLSAEDIAGDFETVWENIRRRYGKGDMPRTVNMITGPSRSADIEHTILLGAHGPKRLHVVIVG